MSTTFLQHTDERVPQHTALRVNRKLRETTFESLRSYVGADKAAIDARIEQLRREWDVERTLEANASAVALTGLALGITVDRRWLVLPVVVATLDDRTGRRQYQLLRVGVATEPAPPRRSPRDPDRDAGPARC